MRFALYIAGRYLRSREDFKKTALILLRNGFDPLDQERLRGLECDDIVVKPFDSEKLALMIREMIDRKKGPVSCPEETLLEEASAGDLDIHRAEEIGPIALQARAPLKFGEHCSAFINSDIRKAIQQGASRPDIVAVVHAHAESILPYTIAPGIPLRPPFIAARADGMSCALPYGRPEWAPTPANNSG